MKDSLRNVALIAAVASLGAMPASSALAAGNQSQQSNRNNQNNQNNQNQSVNGSMQHQLRQGTRIPLLPASDIVGRGVTDWQGNYVGWLDSMVIDAQNGVVQYLLIGGNGQSNRHGQLIAVPWSVVQRPRAKGRIGLTISEQELRDAPHITRSALYELGAPAWRSRVYGYWGAPYPYYGSPAWYGPYGGGYARYGAGTVGRNGMQPENGQSTNGPGGYMNNGQPNGQNNNGSADNDAAANNGGQYNGRNDNYAANNNDNGENNNGGHRSQPSNNGHANANAGSGNASAMNGENGGASSRQMNQPAAQAYNANGLAITENGVVSDLMDTSSVSPNELRSANVVAQDGAEMGHVNEVMIDTRTGHVAYLLLKRGGFLGLNPTWYPVPVQALHHSNGVAASGHGVGGTYGAGNDNNGSRRGTDRYGRYGNGYGYGGYQFVVNEQAMRGIPTVPVNTANLTTYAPKRDLAKLYSHFGVQPYWAGRRSENQSTTNGRDTQ